MRKPCEKLLTLLGEEPSTFIDDAVYATLKDLECLHADRPSSGDDIRFSA